jgi:hypothetical protein
MNGNYIFAKRGVFLWLICSIFLSLSAFNQTRISAGMSGLAALQAAEYQVVVLTAPGSLTDSVGQGVSAGQAVGTGRIAGSTYPNETHAVLWPAGSIVGVDLHPPDFRYSAAFGTNGQKQVGSGNGPSTNFARHALLWSGSANTYIDLHPAGTWTDSIARAIAGDQQVGNINFYYQGQDSSPQSVEHAALWRGTAPSVVDLHPSINGCTRSYGNDTDGSKQVGYCYFADPANAAPYRALLWTGTAASAVVLHPSGYTHSFAEGVSGNEQVGYAFNVDGDGFSRALLWHNTAASVVSLHPSGFITSEAWNTNGTSQVGSGSSPEMNGQSHALRWSGTASSFIDLHSLLPSEFSEGGSIAYDIDAAGNIVGLAQRPDGSTNAVLWLRNTNPPQPTATQTAISVPTGAPTTSPGNMLANASFELDANNDGKPDVWTANGKFTRSNMMVHDKNYAGVFYATDNTGANTRQVFRNITPGAVYTFSGWVNIPPSNDAFTLKLQVKWRNSSNTVISTNTLKTYTASTNGWHQATASLTTPAGTTNAVMLITISSLNRTIYVDEFVLKR